MSSGLINLWYGAAFGRRFRQGVLCVERVFRSLGMAWLRSLGCEARLDLEKGEDGVVLVSSDYARHEAGVYHLRPRWMSVVTSGVRFGRLLLMSLAFGSELQLLLLKLGISELPCKVWHECMYVPQCYAFLVGTGLLVRVAGCAQ